MRNDDCSPERYLILNQSTNLVSGRVLAASGLTDLDIVAQITPSSVEPNTIRCALEQLYADPSNPDLKSVANITVGLCSKLGHSKSTGRYTSSANEAHTFSEEIIAFGDGFLAVHHSELQEVDEGYYGVAFSILDLQRLRLLELYRKLTAQGVVVYGVSTDAFYVSDNVVLPLHEGAKTWDALGSYQMEARKHTPLTMAEIIDKETTAEVRPLVPMTPVAAIVGNTFTTGVLGGAGKSSAQFQFCKERELKTLVAVQSKSWM